MATRSSPDKSVDRVHQNAFVSHPKPSSDYPITVPGPTSPTANAKSVTPSPRSGSPSTSKTVPPFVPLAPLLLDAKSKLESSGKLPSAGRHRSFEETQATLPSAADVMHNSGLLRSFVSLPGSMGEARNPVPVSHDQGVGGEIKEKNIPASAPLHPGKAVDNFPVSLPRSKSGLLKRLATRLTGKRSSPSLRPVAAFSKESPKGSTLETARYPREHEKLSAEATLTPGRPQLPIPDEKLKAPVRPRQNLEGRLSFAAVQGRRTEKREARAREEQRATDARRAAALAKTGLLPASRRYSIVVRPDDGHDLECSHPSPFDPFVKDQIQGGRASDGVLVIEGSTPNGKIRNADELTAAETVVREWRGRNAPPNVAMDGLSPPNDMDNGVQPRKAKESPLSRSSKPLPRPVALVSVPHSVVEVLPSSETTEAGEYSPEALLEEVGSLYRATNGLIPAKGTSVPNVPPSARPSTAISSKNNLKEDMLPSSPSPSSKASQVIETDRITVIRKSASGRKAASDEKAALSHWCFPAPESLTPVPSKMSTQREQNHVATAHLSSSGSTRPGSPSTPTIVRRVNPPCLLDSSSSVRPRDLSGKGEYTPNKEPLESQAPFSPCQVLPSSSPVPPAPPSRQRSSTAPLAPSHSSRTQKLSKAPVFPAPALMVSLPALSPTTSTSTSTSGSSVLPRTPSTSSHGHSPIHGLDAPLEVEEDALLSDKRTTLHGIAESRSEVVLTGVKEFGHLAGLADLDPDRPDDGALPPLPPIISQDSPSGVVASPISELDNRTRITLFGRRRTTQNDHPIISISEHNSSVTNGSKPIQSVDFSGQQPRRVSSFTNLKRTATSVTAVLTGGALHSARDRSPLRQATEPPPSSPAPHSNKFGASSPFSTSTIASSPNQRSTEIGLRPRPLNPTMHSRGSILLETHAIEDAESRRLAELAFLD